MRPTGSYHLLIDKIDTFIRRYYLNKLLRGSILLAAVMFSGFVVFAVLEYLGHFDTLVRGILFFGYFVLVAVIFGWLVLPPLLAYYKLGKVIGHHEAAHIIGKHFSHVQDKLLNTLQLKRLADDSPAHRELIEAGIDQKIAELKPISFPSAISIKENTRYLKWALLPLAFILVLWLVAPYVLKEGSERLIKHNQYFAPVAPFQFVLANKILNVVQGSDFKLEVLLKGNQFPNEVYLQTGQNTFKLEKERVGRFKYQFSNVQQDVRFRLIGNDFASAEYQIVVYPKPSLLHFDVSLQYPTYIHKHNDEVMNAGDLNVPEGTIVNWHLHTINSTALWFRVGRLITMLKPEGNVFQHSAQVMNGTDYSIKVLNNKVTDGDSASYRINVVPDQPPLIEVAEKRDSLSTKAIYFDGKLADDYGFAALTFHYSVDKHNGQPALNYSKTVKADLSSTHADFFYYWNLADLVAKPGDAINYYFEVTDNDALIGGHRVRTTARTLELPTEKEIDKQLAAGTQSVKQKMQSAIKLSAEVEREAQKLNQLLFDKNSLSFDEKKQIDDLLQKRKELEHLVNDIKKEDQQNLMKRQQDRPENQQLLDKQKQIQNLFDHVLDDKTKDLLSKLQQMMDQNQKEPTQDELSKMQMDSKSLNKELDRVLELYKQLEFDQKLNQNISGLKKLADKLENIANQSKQGNADKKDLQEQQSKANADFDDVKKSLDDLQKVNQQLDRPNSFDNPKADEQQIDDKLNETGNDIAKSEMDKASRSAQGTSDKMQQLAQKLKQMQQQGEEAESQVDEHQLRLLIKNLVNSSFQQEAVMQDFQNISNFDPAYVGFAQKQQTIKDNIKNVEDSLYALSKRVPQIQATVNKELSTINASIDDALSDLGDRKTNEAVMRQHYAMTGMNNLALLLADALQQMQNAQKNGKGGKGKSNHPSLSQLGQMQQKLNENMQKMRQQMQQQGNKGQSSNGQMTEQLAKMAREQQMIRQTLQQIDREENKDGTGSLGNLSDIAKQMEQTEKDIVNKSIRDETLQRQRQIQTRMLEAAMAEQQREQDQQRESNAGKDIPPGYVKALQNYQLMKSKQTELFQTVSPILNYYYKSKIKAYFDQINGN